MELQGLKMAREGLKVDVFRHPLKGLLSGFGNLAKLRGGGKKLPVFRGDILGN
jgi:hypothetical protein